MTAVTIYHNPRCSKSRQALQLLEERDLDINIVLYLETPPDETELAGLLKKLEVPGKEIVRTGEDAYKTSGLSKDSGDEEVIKAIVDAPKLLQRPIVVSGEQARIGRPPENVLEIL